MKDGNPVIMVLNFISSIVIAINGSLFVRYFNTLVKSTVESFGHCKLTPKFFVVFFLHCNHHFATLVCNL